MADVVSPPIHPGEVLRDEFLEPLGLSAYALAKEIDVPVGRVTAIIKTKRGITADTALRLAKYFGTTAKFWMNMQAAYDLEVARDQLRSDLEHIEPRKSA